MLGEDLTVSEGLLGLGMSQFFDTIGLFPFVAEATSLSTHVLTRTCAPVMTVHGRGGAETIFDHCKASHDDRPYLRLREATAAQI